ncbi:MAG: phosphoribosylamine--glycine ligase, partial [Clostridia bacterium]
MSVLVIGSGGREHAICWSLAKSPKVDKVYCLPGNAGIAEIAECHNIGVLEFDKIVQFIRDHKDIDLTIVAPDDPLALGLVDLLQSNGMRAFGPTKAAAIIEASKAFSKYLMKKYNIPTADYAEFDDFDKAMQY